MTLGAALLVTLQIALGLVVNLYVVVPAHHPGANPANYFTGSARSVGWSVSQGPAWLAIHASLGLALVLMAIAVAVYAAVARAGWVAFTSVLGGLLIIGAGFNGASFVDFGHTISSLLMALLALGALVCYLTGLYLLPARE
jgi:hypothetical protein